MLPLASGKAPLSARRSLAGSSAEAGAQGDAVAAQQIDLRQAYLDRVEAEHVLHRAVELRCSQRSTYSPAGVGEPVGQS